MTKDEALKLSLEALKQIDEAMPFPVAKLALTVIKKVLAQPYQEPVAFICEFYADEGHPFVSFEPVTHGTNTPLYTTPPQRKPQYDKTKMNCFVQDLYDKKIQEGKHGHYEAMFHVVHRAIEAAHGIKE